MIGSNSAPGQAWLVPFADMALILFVITAAGLATAPDASSSAQNALDGDAPSQGLGEGVASAVFVDSAQGPPLGPWLASHPLAQGEQLTIMCQYTDAETRSSVAARCEALAAEAMTQGKPPRVIVQEGPAQQVIAYFAADLDPLLARNLLTEGQT